MQARLVLKWRRDKPVQADRLWDALGAANTDIFDTLEDLTKQYQVDTHTHSSHAHHILRTLHKMVKLYQHWWLECCYCGMVTLMFSLTNQRCMMLLLPIFLLQRDPLAFNASVAWASARVASAWQERASDVSHFTIFDLPRYVDWVFWRGVLTLPWPCPSLCRI